MSKGGGGGPQETTSTVTQTNLPEYAQPYFERLLSRTEQESTTPYTTYGGQRFAEFDPYQELAFTGAAGMAAAGTPSFFVGLSGTAHPSHPRWDGMSIPPFLFPAPSAHVCRA